MYVNKISVYRLNITVESSNLTVRVRVIYLFKKFLLQAEMA